MFLVKLMAKNKWVVPVVLGGTAIAVGGYIIYTVFASPTKYWEDQYTTVLKDYMTELDTYNKEQSGALTAAQEAALQSKATRLNDIANNMMSTMKQVFTAIAPVLIAAGIAVILKYFPYEKVSRAITYYKQNSAGVTDAYGHIALMRTTLSIVYADMGNVTLATVAQTQTQMWASTTLYPAMETTISALTVQLPTLAGFQLAMATYLINSLNLDIASTIPSLLSQVTAILSGTLTLARPPLPRTLINNGCLNCPHCKQKPHMVLSV
jgi:hypothetical protein